MSELLVPILVAAAVAAAAWGVVAAATNAERGAKRKLAERLSTEYRGAGGDPLADAARSVRLEADEAVLPPLLARVSVVRALDRRLKQAWPELPTSRFLLVLTAAFVLPLLVTWGIIGSVIPGVLAGVIGGWLPLLVLGSKRSKRQQRIGNQLPQVLDFLSRVLRAGHSLTTGLQMIGQEMPDPIAAEFRRCYDQHSLGQPLEQSLKEMIPRVDSTDFAFFITAVLIQRQTGGDLAEVLDKIGTMIRARVRLQQQVRAKTAEGRLSGYALVAFPALMFLVTLYMDPVRTGVMLKTETGGLQLLGLALVLEVLGIFSIRRIMSVKI